MKRTMMVALAFAALVAGCGDDEEKTTTQTVTQTETETVAAPQTPTATAESGGGEAKVDKAQAEENAREEASRQLETQPGGFTVPEDEWQVSCTGGEGGGPWACKLDSGPCSGTATVTPRADGLTLTKADVGCVAD